MQLLRSQSIMLYDIIKIMKGKAKIYSLGFTLAELVIAVAIIAGVSGFGAANYLNFNEKQTLEQAGKTLKNNLRLAQNSALSGEKDPSVCSNDYKLTGWCFSPQGDGDTYKVYGGCSNEPTPTTIVTFKDDVSYYLPEGIMVSSFDQAGNVLTGNSNKIVFFPLGRGVGFQNDTISSVIYCLGSSLPSLGAKNKYKLQIRPGGEVADYGIVDTCL